MTDESTFAGYGRIEQRGREFWCPIEVPHPSGKQYEPLGPFKSRAEAVRELDRWINAYIGWDPDEPDAGDTNLRWDGQ